MRVNSRSTYLMVVQSVANSTTALYSFNRRDMTKEMLFLAEIYTNWCKSQGLPDFMSADDLRYGRDTTDKLNFYQMNWLETFIDVWDCINQNT